MSKFRTKMSEIITKEFMIAADEGDAEALTRMLMDVAIVYSNLIALCSKGQPEGLEALLVEMEEVVRKNARFGIDTARAILEKEGL